MPKVRWVKKFEVDDVPSHHYFERSDGSYVWYDQSSPNPIDPNCRMWVAFGPDQTYLSKDRRKGWMRVPRRWKTPEAAMKALDKEIPIK